MDLDKAVDIFFLGMTVGACFAIWVMRMLRDAERHGDEKSAGRDKDDPSQGKA